MVLKKLMSLNPDRYGNISFNEAKLGYEKYIRSFIKSPYFSKDKKFKGFDEWLETEI